MEEHLPHHKIQTALPCPQSFICSHVIVDGQEKVGVFRPLPRLDPRMLGHPNNRTRAWRIIYDDRLRKWVCKWNLDEIASIILRPKSALKLDFNIYLRPLTPMLATQECDLSECLVFAKGCQPKYS